MVKKKRLKTWDDWDAWLKSKKLRRWSLVSYCVNVHRHITWQEHIDWQMQPKQFEAEVRKIGSVEWLFKKGLGLMKLWKYIERLRKCKSMKDLYKLWEEQELDPNAVLMYDEYLMRNITRKEWGEFYLNVKAYAGEARKVAPTKAKLDRKLSLALYDFLETVKGKVQQVYSREGYWEGLWDHLDELKLDMADVGFSHIQEAWRMYRTHHPPPPPKPLENVSLGKVRDRNKLFGFPVTAVIRTMGKEGFNFKMCRRALDKLEVDASDTTIKCQLRYARIDFKPPAKLTPQQIDLLWDAS